MPDSKDWPARRVVRMQGYDYSQPGLYYVTICIEAKECMFGGIANGEVHLSEAGLIAQALWEDLPRRFPTVQLHQFILMPNHMHGIIELTAPPLEASEKDYSSAPDRLQAHMNQQAAKKARLTLGQVVRAFKGVTTHDVHKAGKTDFAWQRGYYESLIRDEKGLEYIQNYIINNPLSWMEDVLYK